MRSVAMVALATAAGILAGIVTSQSSPPPAPLFASTGDLVVLCNLNDDPVDCLISVTDDVRAGQ